MSLPGTNCLDQVLSVLDEADKHFGSWTYWDMISLFSSDAPPGDYFEQDTILPFVRPFAQAISGIPVSMKYAHKSKTFTLSYTISDDATGDTVVAVPPLVYPAGVDITVTGGLIWSWDENQNYLLLLSAGSSPPVTGTLVSLIIKPRDGCLEQ